MLRIANWTNGLLNVFCLLSLGPRGETNPFCLRPLLPETKDEPERGCVEDQPQRAE
jgi:hypothetical protein